MTKPATKILKSLFTGAPVSAKEHLSLKEALKPVFFTDKGFMSWARARHKPDMRTPIISIQEDLLQTKTLTPDELVDTFATIVNELNQGLQLELFYALYNHFIEFEGVNLGTEAQELLSLIKEALRSTGSAARSRAITLIAQFAEMSNAQSRKTKAGTAAEGAVELVLRSVGLVSEEGYKSQFKHNNGSNTDFVVWDSNKNIKAYIAVQSSTNDRLRLSSSELQSSGKCYICSLNGCKASSKTTKDIGNALIGGQSAHDVYYVVIEKERLAAIEDAKKQLVKNKKRIKAGLIEEGDATARLRWLEKYAINYNQFAEQIKSMMT